MTLIYTWLIEQHVTIAKSQGIVTLEELKAANTWALEQLNAAAHPLLLHLIIDHRELAQQPSIMQQSQTIQWGKHPRMGWTIIVGLEDTVLRLISKVTAQIFQARFRFVDTIPEALAFLQQADTTLTPLLWLYEALPDEFKAQAPLET